MASVIFPPRQTGSSGGNSNSLLSGSGPPSVSLGKAGDFYIDKTNPSLYGPKGNGLWPSPIPLGGTSATSQMDSTDSIKVTSAGTQTFTLPVSNPSYVELYINGQLQSSSSFSVSGSVATIPASVGLQIGDTYEFTYEVVTITPGAPGSGGGGNQNSPIDEVPTGVINGVNTIFELSYMPVVGTLSVFNNGLRLDNEDYAISGTRLVINLPPDKKLRAIYYR